MNKALLLVISSLFLLATLPFEKETDSNKAFFENLKELCGASYPGEVIHPETPPEGFTDPMVAHFNGCGEDELHIPFHVGSNESRTWILTLSGDDLLFKHDHRHPDGTPERMTNYGGWASDDGSEYKQQFPADDETIALRQSLRSHTWEMALSEDGTTFSYSLFLNGNLYFQADFDLLNPM